MLALEWGSCWCYGISWAFSGIKRFSVVLTKGNCLMSELAAFALHWSLRYVPSSEAGIKNICSIYQKLQAVRNEQLNSGCCSVMNHAWPPTTAQMHKCSNDTDGTCLTWNEALLFRLVCWIFGVICYLSQCSFLISSHMNLFCFLSIPTGSLFMC